MEATTLDSEIVHYLPLLGPQEKRSLLSVIRTFLHEDEYGDEHMSIEEYNRDIDDAVARVSAGEYYTQAEVVGMLKTE